MTTTSPRLRTAFAIVLAAALAAISAAPASAAAPKVVGSLTDSSLTGASSVEVSGHYAYVSGYGQDRINVIDVANPRAPREVGSISSPLSRSASKPATDTVLSALALKPAT